MSDTIDPVTRHHLDQNADRLADEFNGIFSTETIARSLAESLDLLGDARISVYVPVLAHRFARERLRALAQVDGLIIKTVPEVLFVCVHNAGRSQIAAGLLNHHAKGRIHVRTAGSAPADEINPAVISAMAELGIDITQEFPKPLTDEIVQAADVVITMGCGDACPIYPGKRYEDWTLDETTNLTPDTVRQLRDAIDGRVRVLLEELVDSAHAVSPQTGT